jgi:flagellar hook-associated protein 2
MTQPTITVSGLASGIDSSSIISQLMAIEHRPIDLIQTRIDTMNKEKDSLTGINSDLLAFKSAVASLTKLSTWNAVTASSSNPGVLSATADQTASAGVFSFSVGQLAQVGSDISANRFADTNSTLIGSTSLNITVGTTTTPVTVSGTLEQVRDQINGTAGLGAHAFILNDGDAAAPYRLVIQSNASGAASDVSVAVTSGTGLTGFSNLLQGQNATLTFGTQTMQSATNTFTGVIPGLTMTASATGSATITTASNTDTIVSAMQAFVDSYNKMASDIKTATSFDGTSFATGPLFGNSSVYNISQTLSMALSNPTSSNPGAYQLLSQIGVTMADDGTLSLDQSKLQSALAANPTAVKGLFTASDSVGAALNTQLAFETDPFNGLIKYETDTLDQSIKDSNDSIDRLNVSLQAKQELLQSQFSAMESAISAMQAQSTAMTNMLGGLSSSSTKK